MPVFGRKTVSHEAVKKLAAQNRLTYTAVACGAFLDWSLDWSLSAGFSGLNFKEKEAFIFGDGENVVPWTTLEDVGRATAHVLLHPEATLNRPVYVHSVYLSHNQLFEATKQVLGGEGWVVTYNDMEPLLKNALEDLNAGKITASVFEVQIQYCLANKALVHPWERDDNSLLGLKEWDVEKVKGLIQTIAQKTA